ncbi:DUF916 and DUF3324 domain-containing protein [Enterococcus durans]|uniref:DUF916 and DUF3324 domain-containing protein n=1 Tax=Enterococcus durans TaxID=53345 RepID=UPI00188389F2|nr:DUF916 and DUF3324 domain-containing protein [Enterococcus durans]
MIVKPIILFLTLASILFFSVHVSGDSLQSFDAQMQFTNETISPSENDNYFDLQLEPKQKTVLHISITNLKDRPITIIPSFNRATTNQLGVIEYSGKNQDTIENLPADIEKVVTLNQESFTLTGHEQKTIELTVNMPEKAFEGMIAGGLYLQEKPTAETKGNIQHVFSREIAVVLKNKLPPLKPALTLKKAAPIQINQRNAITATLQNTNAAYLTNGELHYEIKKNNQSAPLLTGTEPIAFSPNSGMDYLIFLKGKKFQPGTYHLSAKIKNEAIDWQQQTTFVISKETSNSYNEKDVSLTQENTSSFNWLLWTAGGIILALIVVIAYLLYSMKKNKQ